MRRLTRRWNRSQTLLTLGAVGFVHELLIQHGERPTVLILCAAMMGLPAFFGSPGTLGGIESEKTDTESLPTSTDATTPASKDTPEP